MAAAKERTAPTVENVVSAYRKLRDAKDKLTTEHKLQLAPVNERMAKLENWLHAKLNELGVDSMKTKRGTAYKSVLVKASVTDGEELLKFVQESGLWHILERRVSKAAVQEYIESTGKGIPGVHVSHEEKINIRKA